MAHRHWILDLCPAHLRRKDDFVSRLFSLLERGDEDEVVATLADAETREAIGWNRYSHGTWSDGQVRSVPAG